MEKLKERLLFAKNALAALEEAVAITGTSDQLNIMQRDATLLRFQLAFEALR